MKHRTIVILLHGIGATGAQLLPLAAAWKAFLPSVRFVAPDAPYHGARGHEWFKVDGAALEPESLRSVRDAFDETIAKVLAKEGFGQGYARIAFVGVSQGAIMALDAVASGRWKADAVVSFAGLLAPGPVSTASRKTPILLVHGGDDRTIPSFASSSAATRLRAAGFEVDLYVEPGVDHTISSEGAQMALAFLRKRLPH